jgi:hypothetical protein
MTSSIRAARSSAPRSAFRMKAHSTSNSGARTVFSMAMRYSGSVALGSVSSCSIRFRARRVSTRASDRGLRSFPLTTCSLPRCTRRCRCRLGDQLGALAANALTSRRALPLRLLVSLSSRDHVLETEMSAPGQGRPWPTGRWHSRSTPSSGNTRAFRHLRFVPQRDENRGKSAIVKRTFRGPGTRIAAARTK